MVVAMVDDAVDAGEKLYLGRFRSFEGTQGVEIFPEKECAVFEGGEVERSRGGLRGFDAEAGKRLEFREFGRAGLFRKPAGEFGEKFGVVEFCRGEIPERVFIALLIEAAIDWDAANLPGGLEYAEAQRERRRHRLLDALGAETAGGFAKADRMLRAATKRLQDRRAGSVNFLFGNAEFGGEFEGNLSGVAAAAEGEVGFGHDVRAAPGDGAAGFFAARTGAGEKRQIGVDASHGSRRACAFEDGGRGLAWQPAVETLLVRPPGA